MSRTEGLPGCVIGTFCWWALTLPERSLLDLDVTK